MEGTWDSMAKPKKAARLKHADLRRTIIAGCREMNALGINQGTSGNISARVEDGFLITPSGIPYGGMEPEQIVLLDMADGYWGDYLPSSEWRMAYDILPTRPHTGVTLPHHPPLATA